MQNIIVTVDVVLLTLVSGQLNVVLHTRQQPPEKGCLALPGGYVHTEEDRSTRDAAKRVLFEKVGLIAPYLAQLQSFSSDARDVRGWSISDAYYALVGVDALHQAEGRDAVVLRPVDDLGNLAFDHCNIVHAAVARVRNQATYSSLPLYLLPPQFTLSELMATYEAVIGAQLDKSSFRAKVRGWGFLEAIAGAERVGAHRPAQLFRLRANAPLAFFNKVIGELSNG